MAKILFLAHRLPFPPDKGDKIRAFHILRRLSEGHQVWLGACVDDARDMQRLPGIRPLFQDVCLPRLGRLRRAMNMLLGAVTGAPLSVARFAHPQLGRWVRKVLLEVEPDVVFVFSSAPARYVVGRISPKTRLIVDFVDADTEKWRAYAASASGPMRWLYGAEARRLARFDRAALEACVAGVLISDTERTLLTDLLPAAAAKLSVIPNGVDAAYFGQAPPPPAGGRVIVFCGRMDYRPNADGAVWFAQEILPSIRQRCADAVFQVVGAGPTPAVLALAKLPGVEVTGAVADVRPYLAGASVVVAPLRIARGIQNKVLEGMACGRPVVATPQALDGIGAQPGREVLVGDGEVAFAEAVCSVLLGHAPADIGDRARDFVLRRHQWSAQLADFDPLLDGTPTAGLAQAAAE